MLNSVLLPKYQIGVEGLALKQARLGERTGGWASSGLLFSFCCRLNYPVSFKANLFYLLN